MKVPIQPGQLLISLADKGREHIWAEEQQILDILSIEMDKSGEMGGGNEMIRVSSVINGHLDFG